MLKTINHNCGLALQSVILKKSDDQFLDKKSAQMIIQLLGQERGIALKIAQMMGSNDAALEEFKKLTEGKTFRRFLLKRSDQLSSKGCKDKLMIFMNVSKRQNGWQVLVKYIAVV